jgi:mRNA interferase HigB
VNLFTKRALKEAAEDYQEAAKDLAAWQVITSQAQWRNFDELRVNFPKADDVDGVVVFNIRHNRYRLLTCISYGRDLGNRYSKGSVFIKAFMTHDDYDKWSRLSKQKREKALWPRS